MMSLPRGDGAKMVLDCIKITDNSGFIHPVWSGSIKHLEMGGQEAHQCQSMAHQCHLHGKADMRDIGATLLFECFSMLFSWGYFNIPKFLSTYLESAVLLRNGFSGQFSIEVDCLHSQNITSGWVLVPVNGWGCLLLPAGSLQHIN